jgi:hypothetical protein
MNPAMSHSTNQQGSIVSATKQKKRSAKAPTKTRYSQEQTMRNGKRRRDLDESQDEDAQPFKRSIHWTTSSAALITYVEDEFGTDPCVNAPLNSDHSEVFMNLMTSQGGSWYDFSFTPTGEVDPEMSDVVLDEEMSG